MRRELVIGFFVPFDLLFDTCFIGNLNIVLFLVELPLTSNRKKGLLKAQVMTVIDIQVAFAHTEIVHRIKDIGFASAIWTYNSVDARHEVELEVGVVLVID